MQTTPLHSQQRLAILRILLVRHGLSEDNLNSIWAGHKDSPLASTGILQAKALGAALSNYNLSAIYSSDLKRASRTAEEILQANRSIPPPPLVQTQSLREQNFGQAEGWNYSDAEHLMSTHGEDPRSFRFPEGESAEEVNGRMGVSLRRYVLPRLEALRSDQEREEPQIVIVAHGIAIAELLRVLMALHDSSSGSPWPDPRETYTRIRLENTGWTLVELAVFVEEDHEIDEVTGRRKPIYTRIVQQNNTDHLRGFSSSNSNGSVVTTSKGSVNSSIGPSNGVGSLLAGGLGTTDDIHGGQPFLSASSQSGAAKAINAYDAKYMMRELEKAGSSTSMLSGNTLGGGTTATAGSTAPAIAANEGMLALPPPLSTVTPTISSPSQNVIATQSPGVGMAPSPKPSLASAPGAWSDLWQSICVRILPLFNDEELKGHVEDVNDNVSTHIQQTLARSPARAMENLSKDLYALCATGMLTLHARLTVFFHDDFRLLESLTEIWTVFFTSILPWLEACFLPLQTDATLASLSKGDDKPLSSLQTEPIDIRSVALTAFRDQLVLPWHDRILPLCLHVGDFDIDLLSHRRTRQRIKHERLLYPRLMQMTNILSTVLINGDEEATNTLYELLQALRSGNETFLVAMNPHQHAGLGNNYNRNTTSSSAAVMASREKRNNARHGWLPKSAAKHGHKATTDGGNESAYLSSLKSPIFEDHTANQTSSMQDTEGTTKADDDDDIDQAQFVRMGEDHSDEDDVASAEQLPRVSGTRPSALASVQEPALGLGLPLLDKWEGGEEKSGDSSAYNHMTRATRSSS